MNCSQWTLNESVVSPSSVFASISSISLSALPLFHHPSCLYHPCSFSRFPLWTVRLQAWLTEIHEYAQQDVVVMLLGNKVRPCCQLTEMDGQMET